MSRSHDWPPSRVSTGGALGVLVLVPAATWTIAVSSPSREPLAYVGIALVHLLALAYAATIVGARLRSERPWAVRDLVPTLAVVVGVGLSLTLTVALASAAGIRGSAVPRLRGGIALPADLPYVVAFGLAVGAVVCAVVIALVPVARHGLDSAVEVARAVRDRPDPPPQPVRPVRFATREADGFWRRLLSPVTRVLAVLGATVSLVCLLVFSLGGPAPDTAENLTLVIAFAPAPAIVWSVLESWWRLDELLGPVMGALWRTLVVPLVLAPIALAPSLVASLVPAVWRGYSDQVAVSIGRDGLVQPEVPAVGFVAMAALVALMVGMIGGLAVAVAVVIPATAALRPDLMIGDNQMSLDPADRRRNVAAVRLLAAVIVMIFVVAIFMASYENGRGSGAAALLSLVILVALTAGVFRLQRVDHGRRARSGTSARVTSPTDPRPPK